MKVITSKENAFFKECKELLTKKYRDRNRAFLVEGKKLVAEALESQRCKALILREDSDWETTKDIDRFGEVRTVMMKDTLFDQLASTETSQGVLAVVSKDGGKAPDLSDGGCIVVLDRLQDPGNIGTVIRTAEAAGYRAVLTVKGTGDVYAPKVVRAAAGSLLRMPILQTDSTEEAVAMLEKAGKRIVVTALDATTLYYDCELTQDVALVIGNEGRGVSEEWQQSAHEKIKLPMFGKTESLNAAVAAGILMYQAVKKG